ncbi:phage major tail protein, TP901-1 family [Caldifermentibacillus hisashii]|uniref:phage major tail protein, TP901-1 family n=1 Tax=Caldifermentibacillus hisashii TaxID=996558 RepID=UPI0030EADA7A
MTILKGKDIVYAVRVPDEGGTATTLRVLYQTSGSRSKERDEVDVSTKDISGSAYGLKTETISFEGLMSADDPALQALEDAIDNAEYPEILEINVNTLEAKVGKYMISSFEVEYPGDDNATYSFEASLVGETTKETLTTVPAGADEI